MNTTTTQKNTTKKIYGPVSELVISYGQEDEPIISYDQENNLVLSYCQTDNYYSVIGLIDDSVDTVTIPERIDNIPVKEINISRSSETSRKYSLIIPPTIERVNSLNEIVPGAGYNHLLYTLTNLIDYNGSKYLGTEKTHIWFLLN